MLSDSGLENISEVLQLKCKFSKQIVENSIKKNIHFPNINELIKTQKIIDNLKDKEIDFTEYYKYENDLEFFFKDDVSIDVSSLEQDTFGQLIFQNDHLKIFNSIN